MKVQFGVLGESRRAAELKLNSLTLFRRTFSNSRQRSCCPHFMLLLSVQKMVSHGLGNYWLLYSLKDNLVYSKY